MKCKINDMLFISDTEYKLSMLCIKEEKDYLKIKISLDFGEKTEPKPITIKWQYPACNIISAWFPGMGLRQGLSTDWDMIKAQSRSASSAPILTLYGVSGNNALTIALTDVLTPLEIATGIIEENANLACSITLFTQKVSAMSQYETELILDMRDIEYYEAIEDISRIWSDIGYKSAYVPEAALRPMYSTWYSYHQNLDRKALIKELKLAKEYGMETVIVDDGWQTLDNNRGYGFCGEWKPERFPDMKELVEEVHALGMKYMMWYSVPFVGRYSKVWDRFSDKFLDEMNERLSCCTLDPRYPKVRDYLISIYEKAVIDWKLDGLKLDFIDSFELTDVSSEPNNEMDYESLEEAVCALLSETKERLEKLNPNILIEFRQMYMGPIMRTYGNMIRVADCPMSPLHNRSGSISLRMTSAGSAVHSDMIMWNYEDTAESAALELINILFSVPQISMRIENLSEEHKNMLKFYLDFWNGHRDCLINGKLIAKNPEQNYSLVYSSTDTELIAVSYSKNVLNVDKKYNELYFVNGSWDDELIINNKGEEYLAEISIYDCRGNVLDVKNQKIVLGCNAFSVPDSGMITIKNIYKGES